MFYVLDKLGKYKSNKIYDILFPFQLRHMDYKTLVETNRTIVAPSTVNPILKVTTLYATSCSSLVLGERGRKSSRIFLFYVIHFSGPPPGIRRT